MIFGLEGLVGTNTTPTSRITSAIISLIILLLIYQKIFVDYEYILFLILAWHLVNQLIASLIESKKYACHKCGKTLKVIGHKFEPHKCKK